jgi:hypothetical protein
MNVSSYSLKLTPGGYAVEFALDWFEMDFLSGLTTEIGRDIGFEVEVRNQVSNNTETLAWNNNTGLNRSWTEATNFGIISLGTFNCPTPVVKSVSRCGKGTVTLTTLGGTDSYWYASENSTSPIHIGKTFTTPVLSSTTSYYISNVSEVCKSETVKASAIVDYQAPSNPPPAIDGPESLCASDNRLIYSLKNDADLEYMWRASGGNIHSVSNNYIEISWPFKGTGTISAFIRNGCGLGPERSKTININSVPDPDFSISGSQWICPGEIKTYTIINPGK